MNARIITMLITGVLVANTSATTLLFENFEDGLADGWVLSGDAAVVDVGGNMVIQVNSLAGPSATMPEYDLTSATYVTIEFNYSNSYTAPATRWADLEFFDGTGWNLVKRYNLNEAPGAKSHTINAGFAANNQFRFLGKSDSGGSQYAYFDDVKITSDAVIPESSAMVLGGLGCLLMLRRRARA